MSRLHDPAERTASLWYLEGMDQTLQREPTSHVIGAGYPATGFCIASVTGFNFQVNVGLFLGRLWIEVGRIVTGKYINVAGVLLTSLVWFRYFVSGFWLEKLWLKRGSSVCSIEPWNLIV